MSAKTPGKISTQRTEHLGGIHVKLVRHYSRESSDQESEDVNVTVEERIRPNQQDDLGGDLVPHRQGHGDLE